MDKNKWVKKVICSEFVSESCCFIEHNHEIELIAGSYKWSTKCIGKNNKIRMIDDAWLPEWPYKDRFDIHAGLRKGGGPAQYKADTYDFAIDLNGDGKKDVITVGMHKDPIYWYENTGDKDLWPKHLVTEGGVYESVVCTDLFNCGSTNLITVPQKPYIAWYEAAFDPYLPWSSHIVGNLYGDWHGLGVGDVNGDGKNEIITKSGFYYYEHDPKKEWKWMHIKTLEDGKLADGLGDIFLVKAVKINNLSKYPVLFSTCPHGFGFWYFTLMDIKDGCYIYKKNVICNQISQLHNINILDTLLGTYIITGKRWLAHGENGDVDAYGAAKLICYKIKRNGEIILEEIDGDSGAGICFDTLYKDGKIFVATANKKGLFLFEREE